MLLNTVNGHFCQLILTPAVWMKSRPLQFFWNCVKFLYFADNNIQRIYSLKFMNSLTTWN